MDQIIENPGFQHLTEKILLNLPLKDSIHLKLVNKSLKDILDDPMFWIKKWILKGLSKKNKDDWIKAIELMENTKLIRIIILYIKKVIHRDCIVDMPCHIDEKTVEKFSKFDNETAFQKYFEEAIEDQFSIKRFDAGSIQICIALVRNPNVVIGSINAICNSCNDIVKVMAPFIGNANVQLQADDVMDLSPIQYAMVVKNTESINLLAHFCDDYNYKFHNGMNLIHFGVILGNVEAIKILAPFLKNPLVPDDRGETPIQKAIKIFGPNHEIVQFLQTFQ